MRDVEHAFRGIARSLLATYGADPPDESDGTGVAYALWLQQLPRGVIESFGVVGEVVENK